METLYIDCKSGISGDMTVGALIDLGADKEILLRGLQSLNIEGFKINISYVTKNNLRACDYDVIIEEVRNDDKNVKVNRNYFDICKIIDKSLISSNAKEISKRIFKIKAETGSYVHDIPLEEFYFHESGAVDSIADIVGTAICIDSLKIDKVVISQIVDGHGFIKCKKGFLSVPVPAVEYIVKKYSLDLISCKIEGEMVTPTGAAILAGLRNMDYLPKNYHIKKIGLGNGKRNYDCEGILKVYLIEQ